ncbi:MAG: DUF370 domain-containing protein [Clostridia bacterium]|nr:DUF370 domain-containing protein [Clostridia bacterium]
MYLHLGNETVVKTDDVIGIFDLDNATLSRHTRNFLAVSEKNRDVINVSYELPKSFIVCKGKRDKRQKIYISQISSSTLLKRLGFIDNLSE